MQCSILLEEGEHFLFLIVTKQNRNTKSFVEYLKKKKKLIKISKGTRKNRKKKKEIVNKAVNENENK